MTVPSRRATPSLLHVDSILHHLHGGDAVAEACRFLRAEFSHYRSIAIYRLEGETWVLDGQSGLPADTPGRVPREAGALGERTSSGSPGTPPTVAPSGPVLLAVPIRTGGVVEGLISVEGETPTAFDDSDRRFLEQVASKLAPEMALPRTRLL